MSVRTYGLALSAAAAVMLLVVTPGSAQRARPAAQLGAATATVIFTIRSAIVQENAVEHYVSQGHWADGAQHLGLAVDDLRMARDDAATGSAAEQELNDAMKLDGNAAHAIRNKNAVSVKLWLAQAERHKQAALAAASTGGTAVPLGCEVGYPAATTAGESTISVSGCTSALSAIGITFPSAVKAVTNYAVESSTGLSTGACSKNGVSLECTFNQPMAPSQTFVVAFGPALTVGEELTFDFTPKIGKKIVFPLIAPAGPKLTVSATASASAGAAPGTAFTFHVKVAGGPFQNVFVVVPSGNQGGFSSPQQSTGGLACGLQATAGGGARWICTPPVGHTTEPPGSYDFGGTFRTPLPSGAVLKGFVTGTGVAPPAAFTVKTP